MCAAAWLALAWPALAWPAVAYAESERLRLTIEQVVDLALSNSRGVIGAVEARALERQELDNALSRYWPELSLGSTARTDWRGNERAEVSIQSSLRLPTGATVRVGWGSTLAGEPANPGTFTAGISQPLLRGNWWSEQIALRRTGLDEQRSLIAFEDAITGVVVAAIGAFRGLAAAQERERISEESLQRAQRQLRVNRVLVEAGDLARRELVQNEAEIANREIDLAEARNRVLEARLSLVDVLDLLADPGPLELVPEETALEWEIPTFEEALQTALAGAGAVRRPELALEAATLALETARQQALWDLSLELGASRRIDRDDTDVSGSARLSIALGDRQPELQIARARAGVAAAERARAETRQQLEIAVRRALNAALMSRERVALAERALALARDTLATERVKLNEGLSSSFRLTRVEQDLVQAERRLVGRGNRLPGRPPEPGADARHAARPLERADRADRRLTCCVTRCWRACTTG